MHFTTRFRLHKFAPHSCQMKILVYSLLVLCFVTTLSAQNASQNCDLKDVVVIDGQAEEWPLAWTKDPDRVFSYTICADESNLYVRVRTEDYYAKRKMAAFGFTLWIDPNGKKKRKLGLRFPVGGGEAEERAASLRGAVNNAQTAAEKAEFQKEIDRKLITNLEVLELIGLSDDPITSTRSGITNGIKVAIGYDVLGGYVYEAMIPFKSYRLSKAAIGSLGVGFETGKYIAPKTKTTAGKEAQRDFTGAAQMNRTQGYESLIGNPNLSYSSGAWATVKFK